MNLSDAKQLFLDQYPTSTKKAYAGALNPLAAWIGPDRPLDAITDLDMLRYTNHIRQSDYAQATIRKHIKTLKTFFNWLVARKLIAESPVASVKNVTVDEYIGLSKAMTDKQLEKLLKFCDRNRKAYRRQKSLILFLADTGCRAGGAAGLRWQDIDMKTCEVQITEKGRKTRPAWFGNQCLLALVSWQRNQNRTQGEYVFGFRGNKLTSDSLQQLFRRVCIEAGIGSHGPHKLRHRKAHQLVKAGVAITTASTVIGDSPEVFIKHYAPRDFESAKEAARLVAQRPPESPRIVNLNSSDDEDGVAVKEGG